MNTADRLMKGAIDFHVHADPDPFQKRRLDALDLARQAKEMGMRAIVFKCHQYGTAPAAYIVNRVVPDFTLVGSLVLNREAGGLNPGAVEVAARTGARVVWMPTTSSITDAGRHSKEGQGPDGGISILDRNGKLVPEIAPILEIVKSHKMVVGTGHISVPEIYAIVAEAKRIGIPVTVTHPLITVAGTTLSLKQQQELTGKGAYIEHTFVLCMASMQGLNPLVVTEHIKAVGAEHCILSTDFGQDHNPSPPEGFRMMLATMLKSGLSERELETVTRVNPAKLLGLD